MQDKERNLKKQTTGVLESKVYLPRFRTFMTNPILTLPCINTVQNYEAKSAQFQEKKCTVSRVTGV
jgi:hypothetical protein